MLTSSVFPGDSALTWCRLAYWEERTRVGAQVSGTKRALEVFSSQPRPSASHDAVSLETLHSLNPKPSQATLRTREKIGLGKKIIHIIYESASHDGETISLNIYESILNLVSCFRPDPESR